MIEFNEMVNDVINVYDMKHLLTYSPLSLKTSTSLLKKPSTKNKVFVCTTNYYERQYLKFERVQFLEDDFI